MITYWDLVRFRNCPACFTLIPDTLAAAKGDAGTPLYDQMIKEGFKR